MSCYAPALQSVDPTKDAGRVSVANTAVRPPWRAVGTDHRTSGATRPSQVATRDGAVEGSAVSDAAAVVTRPSVVPPSRVPVGNRACGGSAGTCQCGTGTCQCGTGERDEHASSGAEPTGPAVLTSAPTTPAPAPATPAPAPATPAPAPATPAPVPATPAPVPAKPAPATPAPAETITSETVATSPGVRTRTDIGVGEEVNLTHAPGAAAWTTTGGTLSAGNGPTVKLTAPDTAQKVTVKAGTASVELKVIAPNSVAMDREPGTGVKHTVNRPDSGIQTRVYLGPDNVNFYNARYRELDVNAAATTPGPYSCFGTGTGHCGAGGGGKPCPDKALTNTVVAGKGTLSLLGDCAYSGDCGTTAPFASGNLSYSIPYEYKVGTGSFRRFTTVAQLHSLTGSALSSSKGGASGSTTLAAPTAVIPQCP